VDGRTKIYESMVKGENVLEPGTPVSFDVLCNEIKGLGINMELNKRNQPQEKGGPAEAVGRAQPANKTAQNVSVERS
jgi:hypothetical protein